MGAERAAGTRSSLRLHPALRFGAVAVLFAALGLLAAGLTLPILSVQKFWIFGDTVSIWSGMTGLYRSGEAFLATVLLVFSILFPFGKNLILIAILLAGAWRGGRGRRLVRWAALLGKWSMLDVFIVAILVATVKLGVLAHASVLSALYFFAGSVIGTNLVSSVLDGWLRREGDRRLLSAERAAAGGSSGA